MRGLEHLHALLRRPDTDISALELVGGEIIEQGGLEVLDDTSRKVMSARLSALDEQLTQSDRPDLRNEREAIASYLAGGTGLGGRNRSSGSHAERARVAARKAIVAALAKIAESDPWLGRHLHNRISTGYECCYRSDLEHPVQWIL
jgi:hypothetical protein